MTIAYKGPLQKVAPTEKGPIYRQGASTDKELIQTEGPYRQMAAIDVVPTNKGPLQTI